MPMTVYTMGAIDSIGIRLNNNAHHYPLSSSISAPNDCCSSYGRFLGLRFSLRPKQTGFRFRSFCALPGSGESESPVPGSSDGRFSRGEGSPSATGIKWRKEEEEEEDNTEEDEEEEGIPSGIGSSTIISSCFVGVLTGIGVVLFNNAVLRRLHFSSPSLFLL